MNSTEAYKFFAVMITGTVMLGATLYVFFRKKSTGNEKKSGGRYEEWYMVKDIDEHEKHIS